LLGAVKVMLVIVFVAGNVTVFSSVLAADPRPGLINSTAIVGLQVLAGVLDVQIPITITDIDLGSFVQQIPADIVEIGGGFGRIYGQTKIPATQTTTLLAMIIIRRHN